MENEDSSSSTRTKPPNFFISNTAVAQECMLTWYLGTKILSGKLSSSKAYCAVFLLSGEVLRDEKDYLIKKLANSERLQGCKEYMICKCLHLQSILFMVLHIVSLPEWMTLNIFQKCLKCTHGLWYHKIIVNLGLCFLLLSTSWTHVTTKLSLFLNS